MRDSICLTSRLALSSAAFFLFTSIVISSTEAPCLQPLSSRPPEGNRYALPFLALTQRGQYGVQIALNFISFTWVLPSLAVLKRLLGPILTPREESQQYSLPRTQTPHLELLLDVPCSFVCLLNLLLFLSELGLIVLRCTLRL